MTPLEAAVEEENEVLRCIQELKSELVDLKQDKALPPSQSLGDVQSQLTKFEEVQREKLEAQTSAMTQLQQQMMRIEQLCVKLSNDLNALAAKV